MKTSFTHSSQEALCRLIAGNKTYQNTCTNPANISPAIRKETSINGQHPYAVILTCSDSRVPPEHIFSAGIGELFVIRTAGNVVGDFELGSIEYGVEHLGVKLIVVMGHSHCGAVHAALEGSAEGYIETIVKEIQIGLHGATNENTAICNNILHSKHRIMESQIVCNLIRQGKLRIVCANYDIASGRVEFYDC